MNSGEMIPKKINKILQNVMIVLPVADTHTCPSRSFSIRIISIPAIIMVALE